MNKYISTDIKTSGLDAEKHKILEFCAIIDDFNNPLPLDKLPYLHYYIYHEEILGNIFALNINKDLIEILAKNQHPRILHKPAALAFQFQNFLIQNGLDPNEHILFAGKNFGTFDKQFLIEAGFEEFIKFHHRYLDVGNLYFDPIKKKDKLIPSSQTCLDRAGIKSDVKHTAKEDALDVIRLIRKYYKLQ